MSSFLICEILLIVVSFILGWVTTIAHARGEVAWMYLFIFLLFVLIATTVSMNYSYWVVGWKS